MISEFWKDIKDFEGLYQVSSKGEIRSLDRLVWNKANQSHSFIKGTIKILDLKGKKYAQIGLARDGKYKKKLIHRLVADAFICNPDNLPEVNHKDLNKLNNDVENLEWVSRLTNAQHAKVNGSYDNFPSGSQKPNSKLTEDAVRHIRQRVMRNCDYSRMYGVKPQTITLIQKDLTRWKHVTI